MAKAELGTLKGKGKAAAEEEQALARWQGKYHAAKSAYGDRLSLMDERERIYLGTREVDGNANTPGKSVIKLANNVRNIAFEFIESQIDCNIPQPKVDAENPEDEGLATIVEDVLRSDLSRIGFDTLNDRQERTCPIQGMSFFEVFYDRSLRGRKWIGDVGVRLIHPKSFIPQPGVYSGLDDMDYFFLVSSVTHEYIRKRYGEEKYKAVEGEGEAEPSVNSVGGEAKNTDMVSEIACWYRNKKGRPGRLVWVGDTVMEHIDDYYARQLDKCAACGKVKPEDGDVCGCGGRKFAKGIVDKETLFEDIRRTNGSRLPAMSPKMENGQLLMGPVLDAFGKPKADETGMPMLMPRSGPTEIPYYLPTGYPIVMRENVPQSFEFGGQSDIDIIRDQQDSIKKVGSKIQEKIMKGGSIVTLPNSLKNKVSLDDAELKVAWVQPGEQSMIAAFPLQPNINQDLTFYMDQYRAAQSTLGITDSFQGKADATAQSGVAKQLQINQATGRLQSKRSNKYKAYKDLFKLMFQFKLAFLDEPRTVKTQVQGQKVYKTFNRYDFLKQDDAGEWYYEDEFLFAVDATGGVANDRQYMYEQTLRQYQSGMYGNPQDPETLLRVWQTLEMLHYPMAGDVRAQVEEQIQKKREEAMMQQQMMQQMGGPQGGGAGPRGGGGPGPQGMPGGMPPSMQGGMAPETPMVPQMG